MNKIHILSPDQAQKIAAGEVIERPANALKELIENALDAGSTTLQVYAEKAGKVSFRVLDNGCGMSADDARLCIAPHATSKIRHVDEIVHTPTFGFRGEALASISAVSTTTIKTRTFNDECGIAVIFQGSKFITQESVACHVGTDIVVSDLFFNIPVRKRFLKQDETEWNQIMNVVNAFCLRYLKVNFKIYHNDQLVLNAPTRPSLIDRAAQLWDHNFAQNLIPIKEIERPDRISIAGYISNPHFWRFGRQYIFFFVNNRLVKNNELIKALLAEYKGVLRPGHYPAACIFITIDPTVVDVNVHPKKEEVRFEKPGIVNAAVQAAIKNTLEEHITKTITPSSFSPSPQHILRSDVPVQSIETIRPFPEKKSDFSPYKTAPLPPAPISSLDQLEKAFAPLIAEQVRPTTPLITDVASTSKREDTAPAVEHHAYSYIGQIFRTYLLIQQEKDLIIIDQHAAHERILYEKLLTTFAQREGTQLLFPHRITLSAHHLALIMQVQDFFAVQGIDYSQFSPTQVCVTAVPAGLQQALLEELFGQVALLLEENEHLDAETIRKKLHEHVHSHLACKTAIKAGDNLTLNEAQSLIDQLLTSENRFKCIHGRPTMWTLTQGELEKHFRRK